MIIQAGAGNDTVNYIGGKNTIDGGRGNDSINVEGNENSITDGAGFIGGNDTIAPFWDDYQFIVIEGYTWTTQLTQDDNGDERRIIVTVLNGNETVGTITVDNFGDGDYENFGKYILSYNEEDGKNIIYNDEKTDNVTNNAAGGNDSIENNGWEVSIDLGARNDTIDNNGDGNDIKR